MRRCWRRASRGSRSSCQHSPLFNSKSPFSPPSASPRWGDITVRLSAPIVQRAAEYCFRWFMKGIGQRHLGKTHSKYMLPKFWGSTLSQISGLTQPHFLGCIQFSVYRRFAFFDAPKNLCSRALAKRSQPYCATTLSRCKPLLFGEMRQFCRSSADQQDSSKPRARSRSLFPASGEEF